MGSAEPSVAQDGNVLVASAASPLIWDEAVVVAASRQRGRSSTALTSWWIRTVERNQAGIDGERGGSEVIRNFSEEWSDPEFLKVEYGCYFFLG